MKNPSSWPYCRFLQLPLVYRPYPASPTKLFSCQRLTRYTSFLLLLKQTTTHSANAFSIYFLFCKVLEVRSVQWVCGAGFLEALGENLIPWLFQLLEATCTPWLVAPSSIFKASSRSSSLFSDLCFHPCIASLWLWSSCLSLIRTPWLQWTHRIIQDGLPISKSVT